MSQKDMLIRLMVHAKCMAPGCNKPATHLLFLDDAPGSQAMESWTCGGHMAKSLGVTLEQLEQGSMYRGINKEDSYFPFKISRVCSACDKDKKPGPTKFVLVSNYPNRVAHTYCKPCMKQLNAHASVVHNGKYFQAGEYSDLVQGGGVKDIGNDA